MGCRRRVGSGISYCGTCMHVLLHSQTHRLGDTAEIRDAVTAYQVHKAVPMSVHVTTFIVRM